MILLRDVSSLVLVVGVLALACASSRAQSNMTPAFYNKPVELKLERSIKRSFGSYLRQQANDYYRQRPFDQLAPESFYPIGWSRDGKFAYYLEPVDEACGCYFAKLYILDLKTDKVLWSFDYESEGIDQTKQEGKPHSLDTLWNANQKHFSDKLREYAIEPQVKFTLLFFPVNHKGESLAATLRTKEKKGLTDDERPYGIIGKATLQLNSTRRGKKTILDHSYGESLPLHVGLLGYVKSPFEPRIAVLLMRVMRGYEGPPHTGDVQVVGASLGGGFKRS
ncbi:MAG: hypothetical protein ND866_15920 [Pyrinomonadaceae bacterium]|nr:hypothetical protein [Pyrinomonadaceae bacterium]